MRFMWNLERVHGVPNFCCIGKSILFFVECFIIVNQWKVKIHLFLRAVAFYLFENLSFAWILQFWMSNKVQCRTRLQVLYWFFSILSVTFIVVNTIQHSVYTKMSGQWNFWITELSIFLYEILFIRLQIKEIVSQFRHLRILYFLGYWIT